MLFNSLEFLVFLPLSLLVYYSSRGATRLWAMLAVCYTFYGWWEPAYLPLIIASTLITYYAALGIANGRSSRLWLIAGIVGNAGMLFFYKYFNFVAQTLCSIGGANQCVEVRVALPVGISFYTFQAISYLVDVHRDKGAVEPSLRNYAYYHAYFPQLVAGPIERVKHLLPQLLRPSAPTYDSLQSGLLLIAWGLFMKMVIADGVAPYVNQVYGQPNLYSGGHLLIATFLFSYQIFCDFAGYSTIAVGVARLMGVELMINFRRPYLARSVREFWQRWHISLSTWFRDYVYIPLGGNRVSQWLQYRNLMLVFVISGLWHGANWTFVVWGGLHGAALILERIGEHFLSGRDQRSPQNTLHVFTLNLLRHLAVLAFVGLAWIFFRAQNLEQAWYIVCNLFTGLDFNRSYLGSLVLPFSSDSRSVSIAIVLLTAILTLEIIHWIQEYRPALAAAAASGRASRWAMILALAVCIALLGQSDARSFIYFQF